MPSLLQGLYQQPFRTFDRNARDPRLTAQSLLEQPQSRDVMGQLSLVDDSAHGVNDAELVMRVAPVDTDERVPSSSRFLM